MAENDSPYDASSGGAKILRRVNRGDSLPQPTSLYDASQGGAKAIMESRRRHEADPRFVRDPNPYSSAVYAVRRRI